MLSSIHPLGERARGNRWVVTIAAFVVGAVATGSAVGAALGTLGASVTMRTDLVLLVVGSLALVAGGLDLAGVAAPGPERQVNERWIGSFRGWVYGLGFGSQLGAGLATYVVTWSVWVVLVAELLSGSTGAGALIGAVFGLGRAIPPLAAGWIDRPSRLTTFHERMASLAGPSHLASGALVAATGVLAIVAGV